MAVASTKRWRIVLAPARLRIVELAHVAGTAVSATMVCFPMLLSAAPKTPLRVFCVATFEYLARLRGGTLGKRKRMAIAHACDFGALRDDYYDHRKLDATAYRLVRGKLRCMAPQSATSRYIRQLRQAERSRPFPTPGTTCVAGDVVAYRTSVLDLSLAWLQEISGLSIEPVKFRGLLNLVGLIQLVDDVLDWKDDLAARRPSFVTAYLFERQCIGTAQPMRAQANALLQRTVGAAKQDAGALPFAFAGVLTWTFVIALLRVRFPQ